MANEIPDAWPEDLRVEVLTPVSILRAQAERLAIHTRGLLDAEVSVSQNPDNGEVSLELDVGAPALDFSYTVLRALHDKDMVYPVRVWADCFQANSIAEAVRRRANMESDHRTAASQKELLVLIREILQSTSVRAVLESLIAKSNELGESSPASVDDPMPSDE